MQIQTAVISILLFICAQRAGASPHPIQWIGHHKLLVATSALLFAAEAADAQTSTETQRRCPACLETNPIVGRHPSATELWSVVVAEDLGMTLFDRYALESDHKFAKPLTVGLTEVVASVHAYAAYHNTTLLNEPH